MIGFTSWTPDSFTSRVFEVLSRYLPDPPPYVSPSALWGDPDYVRDLFADYDVHFEFDVMALVWEFPSVETLAEFILTNSGPIIAAQQVVEQSGRWHDARTELQTVFDEVNRAMDGSFRGELRYLMAVGGRGG